MIQLALTGSRTEFLEGEFGPEAPLPRIRQREFSATQYVQHGRTLEVGGVANGQQSAVGDSEKQLLLLVTPTVVGPEGYEAETQNGTLTVPRIWRPTIPPRPAQ